MEPDLPLDDRRLLPFLPLVYLAWADGDLTAAEAEGIRSRVAAATALEGASREALERWLDAARPPSAEALGRLLVALRGAAAELDTARRRSMSELAAELATTRGQALEAVERQALAAIEEALGLAGVDTRELLGAPRPPAPAPVAERASWSGELAVFLDGARRPLRERMRRLLADPRLRPPADADRASRRAWTLAACRVLAEAGVGRLAFPVEAGGDGDPGAFVAAFETLAAGDLGLLVKAGVQFGLFGGSVQHLGSERHRRELLPGIASLEHPGCFAMTETGHGSNVQDVETTATFDPATDELVIETPHAGARKDYIGNAAQDARTATVFAQLVVGGDGDRAHSQGVHAVLVPIRDEAGRTLAGVRIEDCGAKMGLEGVDNGRLSFDRVRVPRENLLDRFAQLDAGGRYTTSIAHPTKRFFTMLGTLVGGRLGVAMAAVTAAKTALVIAVRYGAGRRQFGPAGEPERLVLDYRTHQLRLLPLLATTFAYHFALRERVDRYGAAEGAGPEFEGEVAGLKALATWHGTQTIQTCREACGGQGYLAVNRFAALKADTDVFTTFEGDNTVLLQLLAKQLLSGYRRQFGHLDAWGVVRFLADWAETTATERNPIVTRRTDDEHLLDPEVHQAAFRWRAEHLLSTLARRLKARLDRGLDPFDALLECQDHAVEAARAHVELLAVESFARAAAAAPAAVAPPLRLLARLHAVSRLAAERGWYLESGYFEPAKAKAMRDLTGRLAAEVRPLALDLVDAFAIPDAVLAGSIGLPPTRA